MKEPVDRTFWPPHAYRFGGGGSSGSNVASTPVPATSPPVTPNNAEVEQAMQDQRRQALKKRGFSRTILAGDTGGWSASRNPNPSPTSPKTPTSPAIPGARTLGT